MLILTDVPHGAMRLLSGAPRGSWGDGLAPMDISQCGAIADARQQALVMRGMKHIDLSTPEYFQLHSTHAIRRQHWHMHGFPGPYVMGRTGAEEARCCSCGAP